MNGLRKGKILVVGSTNTDMVVRTERLPRPGETVLGGTFLMNPGGKGANQAVAAARLGADVIFVCKTGNDMFGITTRQQLAQEGIDTRFVFIDDHNPSGVDFCRQPRRKYDRRGFRGQCEFAAAGRGQGRNGVG